MRKAGVPFAFCFFMKRRRKRTSWLTPQTVLLMVVLVVVLVFLINRKKITGPVRQPPGWTYYTGVTNVYEPRKSQRRVLGPMLRALVRNVFGGSASAAMQHLLSETSLSEEELAEIRDMLDRLEQGERQGQRGETA